MLDPVFGWFRTVHDRFARVILAVIATLLVPLMVLTAVATLDNWRQNGEIKAATEAQDKLLKCFDEYAAASASTSKAVRIASVRKDKATAERDETLNREGEAFKRFVSKLRREEVSSPDDLAPLEDSLADRSRAARKLERAQDALARAREENPVPSAPSTFCSVQP